MKEIEVIAIYCIIDDILKSLGWEDDRQAKMSSSEVLTTAIIACLAFGGNFTKALNFMRLFCSYVLEKSRFLRRLNRLKKRNGCDILANYTNIFKTIPVGFIEEYAIDSFPVKVCENIRANIR